MLNLSPYHWPAPNSAKFHENIEIQQKWAQMPRLGSKLRGKLVPMHQIYSLPEIRYKYNKLMKITTKLPVTESDIVYSNKEIHKNH